MTKSSFDLETIPPSYSFDLKKLFRYLFFVQLYCWCKACAQPCLPSFLCLFLSLSGMKHWLRKVYISHSLSPSQSLYISPSGSGRSGSLSVFLCLHFDFLIPLPFPHSSIFHANWLFFILKTINHQQSHSISFLPTSFSLFRHPEVQFMK